MLTIGYSYTNTGVNFKGNLFKLNEVKKMDNILKESLSEALNALNKNIEGKFPEYGNFNVVYESFKNPEKQSVVTDYMLKITKPSKDVKGHEKIRDFYLTAYKLPSPYIAERLLASGNKSEIIAEIRKPDMLEKLLKTAKSLENSLQDM